MKSANTLFPWMSRRVDCLVLTVLLSAMGTFGSVSFVTAGAAEVVAHPSAPLDPQIFMTMAAQSTMAEMQLAKLAQQQAADPAIKAFAAAVLAEQERTARDLAAVARERNLALPTMLDAEQLALIAQIKGREGPSFDTAYARQVVSTQGKLVDLYADATTLSDNAVAEFAKTMLPQLRQRKQAADALPGALPVADR